MKQKLHNDFGRHWLRFVSELGENPKREGLQETPARMLKMYAELLDGYSQDPNLIFKKFKSNGYKDLITLTNIRFYSLCEHHAIPFFGQVHIGYVPNGKILGLSKFSRLVEIFSHRLQTQENFTQELVSSLEKNLKPRGLAVSVEAEHLCMSMRGVRKTECITKTLVVRGKIRKDKRLLDQFYREIREGAK